MINFIFIDLVIQSFISTTFQSWLENFVKKKKSLTYSHSLYDFLAFLAGGWVILWSPEGCIYTRVALLAHLFTFRSSRGGGWLRSESCIDGMRDAQSSTFWVLTQACAIPAGRAHSLILIVKEGWPLQERLPLLQIFRKLLWFEIFPLFSITPSNITWHVDLCQFLATHFFF